MTNSTDKDQGKMTGEQRETVWCEAHGGLSNPHFERDDCRYPHFTDRATRDRMTVAQPVTEYVIAERCGSSWVFLPQCGSWYTDRYYADNLSGEAAAEAALARVAATVPGEYRVQSARTFTRPAR
jgi:hypothetical protein